MRSLCTRARGRWLPVGLGLVLLLACASARADAVPYALHYLGAFGGATAEAMDLNSSGVMVGYYHTQAGESRGFWWDGDLHDLGPGSGAGGINDSGAIAGVLQGRAVVWQPDGTIADLGPGGIVDINNAGDIAGNSAGRAWLVHNGAKQVFEPPRAQFGGESAVRRLNGNGVGVGSADVAPFPSVHAVLYANGVVQDLGTLGGSHSAGFDVNGSGVAVGWAYTPASAAHAFYWDGAMHDLGPGDAYGINQLGQIVGTDDVSRQAFVWHNGSMTLLPDLGYGGGGWAINNSGVISGYVLDAHRTAQAAYWTPVPEPSSVAAMGALIAAMAVSQSRRRRIR